MKKEKRLVNTIQYIVDINYTLYNITVDSNYLFIIKLKKNYKLLYEI